MLLIVFENLFIYFYCNTMRCLQPHYRLSTDSLQPTTGTTALQALLQHCCSIPEFADAYCTIMDTQAALTVQFLGFYIPSCTCQFMAIYQYGMVHSPKYLPTYAYSQFSVESLEPGMYGLNIQRLRMGPWEMHGKIEAWTMRALLGLLLEQLCCSVQHQLLRPS